MGWQARWLAALAGAGYGLMMWCGMTTAVLHLGTSDALPLQQLQVAGLALGAALVAAALAVGAWRTRAPNASPAVSLRGYAPAIGAGLVAIALIAVLQPGSGGGRSVVVAVLGILQLLLAFAAVALSPSVSGTAAWRTRPLRLPIRLLFAMTSGLSLLYLLMDRLLGAHSDVRLMLATLLGLASVLALCQAIDGHAGASANATTGRGGHLRVLRMPALLVAGPAIGMLLATTGVAPAAVLLALVAAALLAAAASAPLQSPEAAPDARSDRAADHET